MNRPINMLYAGAFALAIVFLGLLTAHAYPGEYDGWCMIDDGCAGYIPIRDNHFDLCEQSCTMRNQVNVIGLNAKLFDVICRGDSGNSDQRMMFMTYRSFNGEEKGLVVTPSGPRDLVKCQ